MKDKYFKQAKSIARWRIDTNIEYWLSRKADFSDLFKSLYCLYYRIFDRKYYLNGLELIKSEISKHNKEITDLNNKYIVRDMIYSLHRFGISFQNYWVFDFLHRNALGRDLFISDKLRYAYCELLNAPDVNRICTDKAECYEFFKPYYKRDLLGLYTIDDFNKFTCFCRKHEKFIYKPIGGHSGKGIRIINVNHDQVKSFFEQEISHGAFVVEEIINQGEEMSKIHPSSINTLRVMTFKLKEDIKILAVTLRIGSGMAITDNAGAGGLYAFVNIETGIVESFARNFNGEKFIKHPDTGIVIPGFKIPDWHGAIKLINALPKVREGFIFISWDLAYSEANGWILVEANDNGGINIVQNSETKALKGQLYNYMNEYFSSQE